MRPRIRQFHKQAEPQSCTALAIRCALHEFGVSTFSGTDGGELPLWNELKRGSKKGEEEILPHAAIQYLQERGLAVTMVEDMVRTRPLAQMAPKDYGDYLVGLKMIGVVPEDRAIDLDADFDKDARVFMIVGFIDMGLGKLATHTILCRKEGAHYWALNPDGGTDKAYDRSDLISFLAVADPTIDPKPEFASKSFYIYTGLSYVARKK